MLKKTLAVLAVSGLLGVGSANAIVLTLDDASKTVVRPTSGSLLVTFNATVSSITTGYSWNSMFVSFPFNANGDLLSGQIAGLDFKSPTFALTFNLLPTDNLGLYEFDSVGGPSVLSVSECLTPGSACSTSTVAYSVNVVTSTVPEPGSLVLLGLGLAGLASLRRIRNGS